MKQSKEKELIFLLLIVSLILFTPFFFNIIFPSFENIKDTNELDLRGSGFWNLTGVNIVINDNNQNFSWSKTASENDWCSGNGSLINPYIIKDIVINGINSEHCIEIRNSNAYFKIYNCSLANLGEDPYEAPIAFYNVSNGQLLENDVSGNFGSGIYFNQCTNCSIIGNEIRNSQGGLFLALSLNCNISLNIIHDWIHDSAWGITLYLTRNCTLFSNNMTNGGLLLYDFQQYSYYHTIDTSNMVNNKILYYYVGNANLNNSDFNNAGQVILMNCTNISLSNFNLSKASIGLQLLDCKNINIQNITSIFNIYSIFAENTNNSVFSEFSILNNYYGIYLDDCNNNTVANSTIESNDDKGIWILSSSINNTFYGNHFENNSVNVDCDNSNNYWNSSTIGNFWDDYNGTDANDDNMGDTPHIDTNIEDYLPIWWDAPTIFIVSPSNFSVHGRMDDQNFTIIINEGFGNYSWHEFLETGNSSVFTELNGTIDEELNGTFIENQWNLIDNGTTTIRFYANDSRGFIGFTDLLIHIDILPPIINILSPIRKVSGITAPNFSLSIIDGSLNETWYTINQNNTKYFCTANGIINQIAWNFLPDGALNITFLANDTFGHEHSETVLNYRDTQKPLIDDNQGDVVQFYPGKLYDVDFRDSDPIFNISYVQYTIQYAYYNDTGQIDTRIWTNITTDINVNNFTNDWVIDFTKCRYGENYISVRVYDEAGNYEVLNDAFILTKAEIPYTNPLRDLFLMIMIGVPILFIALFSIYYGSKYYIKNKIDSSKMTELKKKAMIKKKEKYLSLADKYLAKTSSTQDEQIQKTSSVSTDAESRSIAALNPPEDQVQATATIETRTISIICPICKTHKKVIIPKSIIDEAKQLTAVSIAKDIVCNHHFQAFVDKNYIVRGYQKVDYYL